MLVLMHKELPSTVCFAQHTILKLIVHICSLMQLFDKFYPPHAEHNLQNLK